MNDLSSDTVTNISQRTNKQITKLQSIQALIISNRYNTNTNIFQNKLHDQISRTKTGSQRVIRLQLIPCVTEAELAPLAAVDLDVQSKSLQVSDE